MIIPVDLNIFPHREGVYIVGGSVRDLLAGRKPADYDMAVADDPHRFARSMAEATGGHLVEFGKPGHTLLRVVTKEVYFDISPLCGGTIESDLRRRDFTLNAMALDLSSGVLIDPLNGRRDMAAGWVRMVSSDVFRRDPVRLVRAYRMAAALGFSLAENTAAVVRRDAELIRSAAGERIREELFKIFQADVSYAQMMQMADSGLLFSILPELQPLKTCRISGPQSSFILEQTLKSYDFFEKRLVSRRSEPSKPAGHLYRDMDADRRAVLKCAILLHDIGKPGGRRIDSGGDVRFYGHAANSAAMVRVICERLRCSRRQTTALEFILRHHERPLYLFKARRKKAGAERGIIRFFTKCGDLTPDVLLHTLADLAGRNTAGASMVPEFSKFVGECLSFYYTVLRPRASRPLPLTGHDLINEFGLTPSPLFKRILKTIAEENLARPDLTRAQALELVRARLNDLGTGGSTGTE